ncbi:MAG: GNAT family N-acetyltransferase [Candidatus Hodarchaeota archaeon]
MGLEGNLVLLREHKPEDLPFFRQWRNIMITQAWSKALPPHYTDKMYEKREEERMFEYDPKEGHFSIVDKETEHLIGLTIYNDLKPRHSANIGLIIGNRDFWGKGHAYDAQEVLLDFLFCELGVRVIRLWTNSWNIRAIRLAEKSGFQQSVRIKEGACLHGILADNIMMDLLDNEFFDRHPEKKSPYESKI